VAEGNVDVAIVWGPLAGYFVKHQDVPLALSPLPDLDVRTRTPFVFGFAVGVRKSERALLARIQEALDRKRGEIERILGEYGVPLASSERAVQPGGGQPAKTEAAPATDGGSQIAQAPRSDELLGSAD